jgi:hypothetical protein
MAEAEHAIGVDLRRVVHLKTEVRHGLRHEAVAEEREEDRQPVPHEAPAPVRVEREGQHREQERSGGEHPTPVDRPEGGEEREHEADHRQPAAHAHGSRLLRGSARIEEDCEPVERAHEGAQVLHAVCLRLSMCFWPSARSRCRIHQATSA